MAPGGRLEASILRFMRLQPMPRRLLRAGEARLVEEVKRVVSGRGKKGRALCLQMQRGWRKRMAPASV